MHTQKIFSLGALCALLSNAAFAAGSGISLPNNVAFSFFGTAAYTISDKSYGYNHGTISERGGFNSGSNLGAQVDWQLTPRLGVTLQGEISPARDKDRRWRPHLTWGQLTYRATDNWVLKLGRARLPVLLYTQNANVGMSYYAARLPLEVYDLSPTFEYNGISSTYAWDVGDDGMRTMAWDIYAGISNFDQRIWFRDAYPGSISQGANVYSRRMNAVGTFLTYEDAMENNILRAGVHYATVKDRKGGTFLKRHDVMTLPNGAQVYPPVGTNVADKVKYLFFALMADWHLGNGFYVAGELGIRRALNVNLGLDSQAVYLHLRRRFNGFTPYIAWSYSRSDADSRNTYEGLSKSTGVAQYDMLNRISGDALLMANQMTIAIGASYDINTHHRLKLEYAHTRIGDGSYLVDRRLSDGDLNGSGINILTASYNFLF